MPTRYEILSALIESDSELRGDPNGYHHVVVDVVDELARQGSASRQELIDVLYDLIARSFVPSTDGRSPQR